jgi:hypothetical protein
MAWQFQTCTSIQFWHSQVSLKNALKSCTILTPFLPRDAQVLSAVNRCEFERGSMNAMSVWDFNLVLTARLDMIREPEESLDPPWWLRTSTAIYDTQYRRLSFRITLLRCT